MATDWGRIGVGVGTGGLSEVYRAIDGSGSQAAAQQQSLVDSLNPGEKPTDPGFNSLIDPATGLLKSPYQLTDQYDQPVNNVLDVYRQQALLPQDQQSAWAKVMQQQLGLQQQQQQEGAIKQGATAAAQARSAIGQKTGISSSVLNRSDINSQRDISNQLQGIRATGAQQALGITAQDLQNRQNELGTLSNLEMQNRSTLSGRQGQNIQGALSETQSQRDYQQNKYNADLQAWAAGKQAQATAAAGSNGGLLGGIFKGVGVGGGKK